MNKQCETFCAAINMDIVYFFVVILTSVAFGSNPVLKYSFCPLWNQGCEATNFASDSAFEFGNVSSGVYFIDPRQLIPPLSISCTSHEPLHWVLSAKPDVRINSISSRVTNNGSHVLYYYHLNFKEASPGLIRCESYKDAHRAAEVYIALDGAKELYYQQDKSLHRYSPSARKRGGQFIIPCNLIAFDSNLYVDTTRWLTKVPQNVMVPGSVSRDCFSCFPNSEPQSANCTTNCPYGISSKFWTGAGRPIGVNRTGDEWLDCVQDAECAFKVAKYAWKFPKRDCNDDGQVTCSDHFSAMSSYPSKCEHVEDVDTNFRQIGACMVKKFGRELDSIEADYDPRIGFRLKNGKDLDAVYVCGSLHGPPGAAYFMPFNPSRRIKTNLQANNRTTTFALAGISCTVPQQRMEQDVLLQILPCSTLFECETQLQTVGAHVLFRTSNAIVNSSEPISKISSSSYGRIIKHPVRSGVVTCAASYRYDIGYVWDMKFFFTGLDSKIYFTTDHLPPEALISLKKLQTNFNQTTNRLEIQAECTVATFIMFPNLEFFTEYSNGTISEIDGDPFAGKQEDPSAERPDFASQRLTESVDASAVAIRCRAHYRNSMKVVEAVLSIASVEKQSDVSQTNGTSSQVYIVVIPTLGCVILVAGSIALGVYTVCKDKKAKKWRQLTDEEANEFLKGNAAISTTGPKNGINIDGVGFPESYQIIPVDLKLDMQEVLGEGQFGRCVKGQFRGIEVAVKTLKGTSDVDTFKEFLREVKIMAYLGPHENIVQFLGAVVNQLRERVCLAVVELCPCGDLLKYLRKNDPESLNKGNRYSNIFQPAAEDSKIMTLEIKDLVYFCEQIATGMEFLVSKNVIHGDLAARNVLVFPDNVVKITDFGLSRKLYTASNYQKKNVTPLPWAWMAIESLKYMEFSPMTDMWSFGVTVWEIFTFGQQPFAGFSYSCEFIAEVEGGRRLQCPKLAPEEIYQFMMLTWDRNASGRPSFEAAKLFFQQQCARIEQGLSASKLLETN